MLAYGHLRHGLELQVRVRIKAPTIRIALLYMLLESTRGLNHLSPQNTYRKLSCNLSGHDLGIDSRP
jgi:hypothetical protein